jgi:hypothetical protein
MMTFPCGRYRSDYPGSAVLTAMVLAARWYVIACGDRSGSLLNFVGLVVFVRELTPLAQDPLEIFR